MNQNTTNKKGNAMKIQVYETIDIETEVNVSIEQIRAALEEAVADAEEGHSRHAMESVCGSIFQVLTSIDDPMIARWSDSVRATFAADLRKHADRFKPAADGPIASELLVELLVEGDDIATLRLPSVPAVGDLIVTVVADGQYETLQVCDKPRAYVLDRFGRLMRVQLNVEIWRDD